MTEPLITGPATRVMSLRDGTKKMSKSDPSDYSRINLTDDAETIALKLRKAKTDPEPLPSDVEGLKTRPEADNLVGIYAALADVTKDDVLRDHGGAQFSQFKPALADLAVEKLAPIAARNASPARRPGPHRRDPCRRRRPRRRYRASGACRASRTFSGSSAVRAIDRSPRLLAYRANGSMTPWR